MWWAFERVPDFYYVEIKVYSIFKRILFIFKEYSPNLPKPPNCHKCLTADHYQTFRPLKVRQFGSVGWTGIFLGNHHVTEIGDASGRPLQLKVRRYFKIGYAFEEF